MSSRSWSLHLCCSSKRLCSSDRHNRARASSAITVESFASSFSRRRDLSDLSRRGRSERRWLELLDVCFLESFFCLKGSKRPMRHMLAGKGRQAQEERTWQIALAALDLGHDGHDEGSLYRCALWWASRWFRPGRSRCKRLETANSLCRLSRSLSFSRTTNCISPSPCQAASGAQGHDSAMALRRRPQTKVD
jgi:hypothetical protein